MIVGLVLGILAFLALVGALITALCISKCRDGAGAARKRRVSRAPIVSQAPGDSLSSRVQSRNSRSIRLAPIAAPTSQLPAAPVTTVVPTTQSLNSLYNNPNLRSSVRGIPLRHDLLRY